MLLRITIAALLWALAFFPAQAAHLVGGDMSYECLGNNNYEITLKVYRDCYSFGPNVADFDSPAYITIYDANGFEINTEAIYYESRTNIPPVTNNPCVTPPSNVCVEEAVYRFIVNLPPSSGGYDIVYSRCCRNATITNIVDPDQVGATYTVNIDPSNPICNNSAYFNEFPPIVICAGEPLVFDHSATDPDGDVLVYELCTPFVGGDQSDPQPIPPLPPPFGTVVWRGSYSASFPLGASPPLSIDPNTGLLTGTPQMAGQFVVGICVNEFRNGVLVSTTRRDFQFNVTPCNYDVEARIPVIDTTGAFASGTAGIYVYECSDLTVDFVNQSQSATSYYWDFGDLTTFADTSNVYQPTYTYPDSGQYLVTLIANPSFSCADTYQVLVRIYPTFDADFDFQPICQGESVSFTDQTSTTYGSVSQWNWDLGNSQTSTQQNPTQTYSQDGNYFITLLARNDKGCRDSITKPLTVYSRPDMDFDYTPPCVYTDILFTDLTEIDFGSFGSRQWILNNQVVGSADELQLFDSTVTNNTLTLIVTSAEGCTDSITQNFTVNPLPTVTVSNDTDMCVQDTIILQAGGGETYVWLPAAGLNAASQPVTQASPAQTTSYVVYVTDSNECVNNDTVTVTVRPLPQTDAGPDDFVCIGDSYTLQGSTDGISYSWSPGGLLNDSTIANPTLTPDSTIGFVLTTTNIYTCVSSDSMTLEVQYPIEASLATAPELCEFDTLQLQAEGGKYYLWRPGDLVSDSTIANPTTSPSETTTFTLIASNDCPQFTDTLELEVVVHPLPEVDAGLDDTIRRDEFTTLTAAAFGETYEWSPPDGLFDFDQLNPEASPFNTTQYILTVTDQFGCINTDSVNIYVDVLTLMLVPSAFSPNNDGNNDLFRIIKLLNIEEILDFRIYNRWGQKVFETTSRDGYWDGTWKGEPVDMDVFVYYIRAVTRDGDEIVRSGNVTLIR